MSYRCLLGGIRLSPGTLKRSSVTGNLRRASKMIRRRITILFFCLACALLDAHAQDASKTLAEKLGFPRDAKLLIVHADDVGMTHSVNAATIKPLDTGAVNAASTMVPCPWFPEIADYAKSQPAV